MGEQGLITDERLMITDFVHTENAEGNGGPQADEVGEQQLSSIGQQLKENYFLIAVQEKELVVCGQECPVIYRNLSEYFLIAVILQVIAVQEKELVVCGLQLP